MTLVLACFMDESKKSKKIFVHFNPASLKLAVTNPTPDESGGATQTKAKSSSKLDLELIFDSTDNGKDVREYSDGLKKLGFLEDSNKSLPKVIFEWGTFAFTGIIESFNETFEFFSDQGVPLRETISLSMKGLKLDEKRAPAQANNPAGNMVQPSANAFGTTGLAQSLGSASAGRNIAAQNGLESMRFPGASPLSVGLEVSLKGPSGLSAPESGFSIDAGSVFGATASAGVTASGGAFAGLGSKIANIATLKTQLEPLPNIAIGTGFDLAGRISESSNISFKTN
jgi:hypothetical protein